MYFMSNIMFYDDVKNSGAEHFCKGKKIVVNEKNVFNDKKGEGGHRGVLMIPVRCW